MQALLIGINAKYIHPALAIYQLKKNTTFPCLIQEYTIKEENESIFLNIKEIVISHQISLIGFSCYLWNIEKILVLTQMIKQNFPNIYIMCGGPEVGFDAKYYLENNPSIDYIIKGDGENAFHELCLYIEGMLPLEQVSNLCYLQSEIYIENTFKNPDLSKIKLATLDVNDLTNRIVYLESGRGCPYHCSYCTASLDNRVRFFPLTEVMQIVDEVIKRQVKTVKFLDRTFNANMKYMIAILDFIDQHNLSTTFQFEIVVEKFTEEAIQKVASLKNKFLRFEIGIQSIHDDVNDAVCRKQNMELLEKNLHLLNQTGKVDLHVDLIAGLPYETKERFILSFNRVFYYHVKELQLGFLKFLRGTKLLDTIDIHEYVYSPFPPYEIIQNKYLSKTDLEEIHLVEDMLDIYYNKGKFKKTFSFLIEHTYIQSPYHFFLDLSYQFQKGQLSDLCIHLDYFLKTHYQEIYPRLHFLLCQDYLEDHLTRPKIWWEPTFSKEERSELFTYIHNQIQISLDDLYRYSVVIKNESIYVILYKDFKPIHYEIRS